MHHFEILEVYMHGFIREFEIPSINGPRFICTISKWIYTLHRCVKIHVCGLLLLFQDLIHFLKEILFSGKKVIQNRKFRISLSSVGVRRSYSQDSKYSWVLSNDQVWARNSFSASRSRIWSILPSAEATFRKWVRSLNAFAPSLSFLGSSSKI